MAFGGAVSKLASLSLISEFQNFSCSHPSPTYSEVTSQGQATLHFEQSWKRDVLEQNVVHILLPCAKCRHGGEAAHPLMQYIPVFCRDSPFLTTHHTCCLEEMSRTMVVKSYKQIRNVGNNSLYLHDCIPPNLSTKPFQLNRGLLSLVLFTALMCLLTVCSPLSLQGIHECEGAEGGTAAEQHPLSQRLLCQLSEGRAGWCCHLAMG